MNLLEWPQIALELGLASKRESDHHPHVPIERAELFHAADDGSTEFEFLNLLNALVIAIKPVVVLETGTFLGYGTLAIASALKFNGVGQMITLDVDPCQPARLLAKAARLDHLICFLQTDAVEFTSTYAGPSFDFVFHDSGGQRAAEHDNLKMRGKLTPGALVAFHDTSQNRTGIGTNTAMVEYLKAFPKGLAIPLSRGIQMAQF